MLPQLEEVAGKTKIIAVLGLLAFLSAWRIVLWSKERGGSNIPLLTDENNDFVKIMAEGYRNVCLPVLKTSSNGPDPELTFVVSR